MKRTVTTCDVCRRELPLRDEKGQLTRVVVKVRVFWHWPSRKLEEWDPDHICEQCWDSMVDAALKLRHAALNAPGPRSEGE